MTRYLLDTSVLIDYSKGITPVAIQVQDWIRNGDEVGICAIQVAEYFSGIAPAARLASARLLSAFEFWPNTASAARWAGAYRFAFARRGVQLGIPDMLIAGVARALSATLVTRNARDFPMTDVLVRTL